MTRKVRLVLPMERWLYFAHPALTLILTYRKIGDRSQRKGSKSVDSYLHNLLTTLRFLYAMLVCMDANFRLKNNLVSNFSQDPGLGNGSAYMVARPQYEEYILSQADSEDVRTVSNKLTFALFAYQCYRLLDQYLCGLPGTGESHYAKHAWSTIHGYCSCHVRS